MAGRHAAPSLGGHFGWKYRGGVDGDPGNLIACIVLDCVLQPRKQFVMTVRCVVHRSTQCEGIDDGLLGIGRKIVGRNATFRERHVAVKNSGATFENLQQRRVLDVGAVAQLDTLKRHLETTAVNDVGFPSDISESVPKDNETRNAA